MVAVPSRRWLLQVSMGVLVLLLLLPSGGSMLTATSQAAQDRAAAGAPATHRGTIIDSDPATTVVALQGFHFKGQGMTKKEARLRSVSEKGYLEWEFNGSRTESKWYYDVDPLPGNDVLFTSTNPEGTVVVRLDRTTREVVWVERLRYEDTHDADYLGNGRLLIANMRQWNISAGAPDDRAVVYDRTNDTVVWEWVVRNHYPESMDGGYQKDWTHINDVDRVGDGLFLLSLRNFDQAIVVNRSTKEIELRLGEDGAHDVLNEQHNPDLLHSENGTPTILVADSENDRVVEYARRCPSAPGNGITEADPPQCHWKQTWVVGEELLNWPRDADRLPNGNTLITDTLHHRFLEVTPNGTVVWEYRIRWGPYDAERIGRRSPSLETTGGSSGPTMADVAANSTNRSNATNTSSSYTDTSAGVSGARAPRTFGDAVERAFAGTPLAGAAERFATRWAHVTPWVRPAWMSGWDFATFLGAVVVLLGWGAGELLRRPHPRE